MPSKQIGHVSPIGMYVFTDNRHGSVWSPIVIGCTGSMSQQ